MNGNRTLIVQKQVLKSFYATLKLGNKDKAVLPSKIVVQMSTSKLF